MCPPATSFDVFLDIASTVSATAFVYVLGSTCSWSWTHAYARSLIVAVWLVCIFFFVASVTLRQTALRELTAIQISCAIFVTIGFLLSPKTQSYKNIDAPSQLECFEIEAETEVCIS
jgi:hypothetical protein